MKSRLRVVFTNGDILNVWVEYWRVHKKDCKIIAGNGTKDTHEILDILACKVFDTNNDLIENYKWRR